MLVADRLEHARVGRVAGLAAALARQAEPAEQHLLELLGRAERELLAARLEDLALELVRLGLDPRRDLAQPVGVELAAGELHLPQEPHERELDVAEQVGETAAPDLLALPGGQRVQQQRVGGGGVLDVGAETALLAKLPERVGAPRRLEQVGRRPRCRGRDCPVPRPATWRRGRPPGEHRSPPRAPRRARTRPPAPRPSPRHGPRSARPPPARTAGRVASAAPGRRPPTSRSGRRPRSSSLTLRRRAVSARSASGAGAAASAEPSASSSRRSGSRSSNRRNVSRSLERSGVVEANVWRSSSTSMSRLAVASCLESPRGLGVLDQVLLALGAADLVDVVEHRLERPEPLQQVGGGLVADPRDAGDVVAGVALESDEVGDQLGRDAVAVDHALAVVHATCR